MKTGQLDGVGNAPRKARILLAEDNVINQKVALSMLHKLGYEVDVVADGREALRALEIIDYDLVLMDCQMPELDGFETTARIRAAGSTVLNPDVPVIAMTANTMDRDREKCIASGMNGYLAKPVRKSELADIIVTWLANDRSQDATEVTDARVSQSYAGRVIFDAADIMERLENKDFVHSILTESLDEIPRLFVSLREACSVGDCVMISHQAHTLKGFAANISTHALYDIARGVEVSAQEGALESVRALLPEVECQIRLALEAIGRYCSGER